MIQRKESIQSHRDVRSVFTETSFITAGVVVLRHWDRVPEGNQLKGRKVYFGSWFPRLQSAIAWFLCL